MGFAPRIQEQQVPGALVSLWKAISADDDSVRGFQGSRRLGPKMLPEIGKLMTKGSIVEKLFRSAWENQAGKGTTGLVRVSGERFVLKVLQIRLMNHGMISHRGRWIRLRKPLRLHHQRVKLTS